MVVLLDTAQLLPKQRNDAFREIIELSGVPLDITHDCPDEVIAGRIEVWDLGGVAVVRADTAHQRLRQTPRHMSHANRELLGISLHSHGIYRTSQHGSQFTEQVGQVHLRDLTRPFETTHTGSCRTLSLHFGFDELGVTVPLVRRAMPRVTQSPLHNLVRNHLASVAKYTDTVPPDASAGALKTATTELMRALIYSAAGEMDAADARTADHLRLCITAYVREHLSDPDLSAEQIARAHNVSVRQLYKLWSETGSGLMQWIMTERLEGARRELASRRGPSSSVAALAYRWGFTDTRHFGRRFREAYGMSPADWHRTGGRLA